MDSNTASLIKLTNSIYTCSEIYLAKKLEELSLTTRSYQYLLIINKNEGVIQNEISRELNVNKSISSRTIKKLIELEYIRKEENKDDIRAYKLYITDKGRALIPEIVKVIDTWANILVQGCEEKKSKISIMFLEKVLKNALMYNNKYY